MRKVWLTITLLSFGFGPCQEIVYVDLPTDASNTDLPASKTDLAQPQCTAPLTDYCPRDCKTFGQKRSELEAAVSCLQSSEGICGDLNYVENYGLGIGDHQIFYYDQNGTLVAAYSESDTRQFCQNSSFDILYGTPINCVRAQTAVLCNCRNTGSITCGTDAGNTIFDLGSPHDIGSATDLPFPKSDLGGPGGDSGSGVDFSSPADLSGPNGDASFTPFDGGVPQFG